MHFYPVDDAREVLTIALESGRSRGGKPVPPEQRGQQEPHDQNAPGLVATPGLSEKN
jgi:hypothetical protein